ncbi:MAG: serine/threonine-protein kinase [Clostridia bacterium]
MSEDMDKLCMGCMTILADAHCVCKKCGWSNSADQNLPHQLPSGSLLAGKYLVGRALGQGGFGITYIGWDINLELRVAIKEYYPSDSVTRQLSTRTVAPYSAGSREVFEAGRDKFISEAKSLAKFDNVQGIVSVKDFFLENGTAYIVMEYIDGRTFKEYLDAKSTPMPIDEVLALLKPVVESLQRVHAAGLIHRDISPDNIMLPFDGGAKLLDFGAARAFSANGERSSTINIKMGYAPEEQYRTRGAQGPWTDVYAFCATIYKAITLATPVQSIERMPEDELELPSKLGAKLSNAQEMALMKGMAVFYKQRSQSVAEVYAALLDAGTPVKAPTIDDERTTWANNAGLGADNQRTLPFNDAIDRTMPIREHELPSQKTSKALKICSVLLAASGMLQTLLFLLGYSRPFFDYPRAIFRSPVMPVFGCTMIYISSTMLISAGVLAWRAANGKGGAKFARWICIVAAVLCALQIPIMNSILN